MPFRFSVLSILFIAFAIDCDAQKPRLAIFAGPQISTVKYTIVGAKQPAESKYGFQAGAGIKIPIEANLYFSPAAFYSLKGYKVKFNKYAEPPGLTATDNNTSIHTFELAFLLQYDMGKKPQHFFIKAGPSIDFQVKGKETFNLMDGSTVSHDMVYNFGVYGRYCGNAIMQLGFETNGFIIFGQYSYGFVSLNNADGGPKIHYRVYGLSLGKYLGSKKNKRDEPKEP
jgi:hypothetical protein